MRSLLVLLGLAAVARAQVSAPTDRELLVRAAIERGMAVRGVMPDRGWLPDEGDVVVRRFGFGEAALPRKGERTFVLMTHDELVAEARARNEPVAYIRIHVDFGAGGKTASVSMGVSFEGASRCTCARKSEWEKRDGTWRFVKLGPQLCG